jgi:hypothetical protein
MAARWWKIELVARSAAILRATGWRDGVTMMVSASVFLTLFAYGSVPGSGSPPDDSRSE